jgi:ABC-type polysaccharide/polyol phosphate transport system ATPase subunit
MGRNGSGKSTLLKILCGIYRADSGSLHVRAPITPILELGLGWNPELDGVDNVMLIGTAMGLSLREARESLDEILDFAGLERFAALPLKHYSSGMAARLAYSVAFKAVREVLVLDEIFAVGDQAFRARCETRYRELSARGHTVVLVSHEPRIVSTFCNRALLLDGGTIVKEGTGDEVAEDYRRRLVVGR